MKLHAQVKHQLLQNIIDYVLNIIYMSNNKTINKAINDISQNLFFLEKYYNEKEDAPNLSSRVSEDPPLSGDLKEINEKLDFLYSSVQFENLKQQEHIIDKNTNFKKNSLELDKKLKEYINNKDKKNASSIFKLDIYDRNIEDNLFLIYYFLSYGILGLFIYKLLK